MRDGPSPGSGVAGLVRSIGRGGIPTFPRGQGEVWGVLLDSLLLFFPAEEGRLEIALGRVGREWGPGDASGG